jgi:CheY-like chemotaxis protein
MAQTRFSAAPDSGTPPSILVVEDEVLIRLTVADHLRDCGFRVLEAANGDEARRIIEAGETIDLVFSDVQMPGTIDGFSLARWIRANRPGLPVLLTSGYVKQAELANDLCTEIVSKPYDHDDLVRRLRLLVAR